MPYICNQKPVDLLSNVPFNGLSWRVKFITIFVARNMKQRIMTNAKLRDDFLFFSLYSMCIAELQIGYSSVVNKQSIDY